MTNSRREEIARNLGLTRATAEAYYHRGLASHEKGDMEDAILDLNEAIFHDRRNPEYYTTRGLLHLENNNKESAEIDLAYALRLNKRQWPAHYGLGIMRFMEGNYGAALDHFNHAHRIAPRRPEPVFYRAVTYHQLGDFEKSIDDLDRAIDLFPENDKRVREANTWRKEVEAKLPPEVQKAKKRTAKPRKTETLSLSESGESERLERPRLPTGKDDKSTKADKTTESDKTAKSDKADSPSAFKGRSRR